MRILLLSSSTVHGSGYLEYCQSALLQFLGPVRELLFVPYALHDLDAYTAKVADRLSPLGIRVTGIHSGDPLAALQRAEALFIGGGNTFRLLDRLDRYELLEPIRARVRAGLPYVGSSAGSNVACHSIRTTNDMPIVQPRSFDALRLFPFNLNPHYLDPDPSSRHMGETREERIAQFHEESSEAVVGLREGAWLLCEGERLTLEGACGARLFKRGVKAQELEAGSDLSFLL